MVLRITSVKIRSLKIELICISQTRWGLILENEDQQGLAHFVEHMGFNGTKHYPKNDLVSYLQKAGVRFGADLNAYSSFDETVYQLPIPTDDAEIFKNGMQMMRDWAQDATLDPVEVDKERGLFWRKNVWEKVPMNVCKSNIYPYCLIILVTQTVYLSGRKRC